MFFGQKVEFALPLVSHPTELPSVNTQSTLILLIREAGIKPHAYTAQSKKLYQKAIRTWAPL